MVYDVDSFDRDRTSSLRCHDLCSEAVGSQGGVQKCIDWCSCMGLHVGIWTRISNLDQ